MVRGSLADGWNMRLLNNVGGTLPVNHSDTNVSNEAVTAVCEGMIDIAPADPIEGILIGQLMAANEVSLAMYRKGWAQPPEYSRHCRMHGARGGAPEEKRNGNFRH